MCIAFLCVAVSPFVIINNSRRVGIDNCCGCMAFMQKAGLWSQRYAEVIFG